MKQHKLGIALQQLLYPSAYSKCMLPTHPLVVGGDANVVEHQQSQILLAAAPLAPPQEAQQNRHQPSPVLPDHGREVASLSDGGLPPLTVLPPLLPPCSDREKRVRKALAGTSPEAVGAVSRSRTRPGMRAIEGLTPAELSAVGVSAAAAPAAPVAV